MTSVAQGGEERDDSEEQEIDMSGAGQPSHNDRPIAESNIHVNNRESVNPQIANLGKDMTDDEFLHAIANAPDEMLIPWEDVPLPSGGIYYEGWDNGTVKVRAMTQSVEKAFANKRLIQNGGAIERMFEQCTQLPGDMSPQQLLVGDRAFLLYYIRGLTYGNLYKFVAICPECGAEANHVYDMNELYNTVIPGNPSIGGEPFKVTLPHLSAVSGREIWVGVRFLRQVDIANMMSHQRFNKKLSGNTVRAGNVRGRRGGASSGANHDTQAESMLENSVEKIIMSVNGNNDPVLVQRIASRLHARDHAEIRDFLKEYTPGIDVTVSVTCQECSNEATMMLPFTDNFFRSVERSGDGK